MGVGGVIGCDEISDFQLNAVIRSSASTHLDNITVLIIGTENGSVLQVRKIFFLLICSHFFIYSLEKKR